MRKRILIVVAMVAPFGLQFADGMPAMTQNQQSMKCCGFMPCDPSNQSHDYQQGAGKSLWSRRPKPRVLLSSRRSKA
jgi:hypothetical protein